MRQRRGPDLPSTAQTPAEWALVLRPTVPRASERRHRGYPDFHESSSRRRSAAVAGSKIDRECRARGRNDYGSTRYDRGVENRRRCATTDVGYPPRNPPGCGEFLPRRVGPDGCVQPMGRSPTSPKRSARTSPPGLSRFRVIVESVNTLAFNENGPRFRWAPWRQLRSGRLPLLPASWLLRSGFLRRLLAGDRHQHLPLARCRLPRLLSRLLRRLGLGRRGAADALPQRLHQVDYVLTAGALLRDDRLTAALVD